MMDQASVSHNTSDSYREYGGPPHGTLCEAAKVMPPVSRQIRFFHQLDADLQKLLEESGTLGHYGKGEVLLKTGDSGDQLHILLQGKVKVHRAGDQRQLWLSILEAGDLFGELSMIDDRRASASVTAMEHCTILSVKRDRVLTLLSESPNLLLQFLSYLSSRLRSLIDDTCSIAFDDVYCRLKRVLYRIARERDGQLQITGITHLELSEMVGASREMVSIILKELREGSYISCRDGVIHVVRKLPDAR